MNFEKNPTVEAPKNKMEQVDEQLEAGQEISSSQEMEEKMAQELEMSKNMVKETMTEIESMKKTEPGMKEIMPTTESGKRLFENVGYDPEEIAKDKERFANMPDAEMYNQVQILTLEKTKDLINGFAEEAKDAKAKNELMRINQKINALLAAAEKGAANGQALTSYAEIMSEHANKKPDGYMMHDGLGKLYKKAGYDSSFFKSNKVYESFQNDILENVLEPSKQELFKKISKEATRTAGHSGAAYAVSGMSQKISITPIFSRNKAEDIIKKI